MKACAIITAAGAGKRMGASIPKQFLEIGGVPILQITLSKFAASKRVNSIIVVTEKERMEEVKRIAAAAGISKRCTVIAGGTERQDSVRNGLAAVSDDTDVIVVHDGVRPFIEPRLIDESIEVATREGGAIVAVPVSDTVKRANAEYIGETVKRDLLWAAQTPQTFRRDVLERAFFDAYRAGFYGTDEASLVERLGLPIRLIKGDKRNIKITTPEDMALARSFLEERHEMRTGIGYDLHRTATGRRLVIGGVNIPFEKGLAGHSDADVLLHAIIDSLLGASALGDIGQHFPDTDPQHKDADSRALLRSVAVLLKERGFAIGNIDANIIAEKPKMMPHIGAMRKNIAEDLEIGVEQICVKAKTNEGCGEVGKGEAIAAESIALLSLTPNFR